MCSMATIGMVIKFFDPVNFLELIAINIDFIGHANGNQVIF
jgi:hypothetical protein